MNVIELRNINALVKPDILNLLKRAVESGHLLTPYGFDSVAQDMINFVKDPRQFMFLGAENGQFKACAMGFLPNGNLFPYPTIVLLYNEGSRALSRAVQSDMMDFIVSNGYTRVLAVNTSGHEDAVWQRGLTPKDAKSEKVGSLVLFEVK